VIDREFLVAVRVDAHSHQGCSTLAKPSTGRSNPAALNTYVFAGGRQVELVVKYDD